MIYLRMDAKRRPKRAARMLLAHNVVEHAPHWPSGPHGFRAFFFDRDEMPEHFVPCPCGWRPELGKHYATKGFVHGHDTPRKRAKRQRELEAHWQEVYGAV